MSDFVAYYWSAHIIKPWDWGFSLEMERRTGIAARVWMILTLAHFAAALEAAPHLRVDIAE
jgi:hypothetical protein